MPVVLGFGSAVAQWYRVRSPLVACRSVLEQHTEPGRFSAARCSSITKDGSNPEKNFPTGINKGYITIIIA